MLQFRQVIYDINNFSLQISEEWKTFSDISCVIEYTNRTVHIHINPNFLEQAGKLSKRSIMQRSIEFCARTCLWYGADVEAD